MHIVFILPAKFYPVCTMVSFTLNAQLLVHTMIQRMR